MLLLSTPTQTKTPTLVSPSTLFVAVEGLALRRTERQAHAAGFPSVAAWTDALAAPASLAARYRQAAAVEARRAVLAACQHYCVPLTAGADLLLAAKCAIGVFLARRIARFPRLARNLLTRTADGTLPRSMRRALRLAARLAVTTRVKNPPARRAPVTSRRALRPGETRTVNALLSRIRVAAGRSDYSARCARVHSALLEGLRAV